MTALTYYAAAATASIFFIMKVCEEKFVSQNKTLKVNGVLKSSIFVYVAALIGAGLLTPSQRVPL